MEGFLQKRDALYVEIISVHFQKNDFIFHFICRPLQLKVKSSSDTLIPRTESKVWRTHGVPCTLQSLTVVVIKVSSHPPDLIFLVGIPSTSEDVGSSFYLADTFSTQRGAWRRHSLNSRFFRPVVSIPHASLGAKRSSSAFPFKPSDRKDVMLHLASFTALSLPLPLPHCGTPPPLRANCSFSRVFHSDTSSP